MIDIIVSVILAAIIGGAITYIVLSKKRGEACVGCPYAKECAKRKNGGGSCGCSSNSAVVTAHHVGTASGESDGSGSDQPK
ncbi:MAG: FeoB-associated Cys-rich membrane protein [Clostridia bacterium]|nr:FeoB-associated Cys-rich membrane protein [Clostridia bacterium]